MAVGHLGGRTRTKWAVHNLPLPTLHEDLWREEEVDWRARPGRPCLDIRARLVDVAMVGWDCRAGRLGERGDDGGKD
jgi:hypothetical protein